MKNKAFIGYFIFAVIVFASSPAVSEEIATPAAVTSTEESWTVAEGSYATIYVEKGIDLKSIVRRINVDFARYDPVEKEIFLERGISDTEKVANKIDIIVRKARKILDMYPQDFRVNIKIYSDVEELSNIYKEIFEEEENYKAFYVHKFKTIYISLDNISESVLAHEIGHSVIDSYFNVLPPQKIRELLACYVDVHLRD